MLRGLIKNGDATNKIPILDPYVFDVKQIDLQDNYYSLQSNISDFTFTGMGNFLVEEQEFFKNEVAINVKLHFPVLKLEAEHYEMEGVVMEAIPIGGKGVM
ncbi:unnamed protein product [Diatraea saccharalis]|uniref:Uncharacterized protein n=1 Tax=Diatraea saccharalis TaxID=40085 RepID=A0A9N9QT84_9NEOP|nr:unnamed protein product [Diatraea saccharalis]